MDHYRLDEIDNVWRRLVEHAWSTVRPAEIPYRRAALRVIEARAEVTEDELRAYMAEHEWSAGIDELQHMVARLAAIRGAAHAAREALTPRASS